MEIEKRSLLFFEIKNGSVQFIFWHDYLIISCNNKRIITVKVNIQGYFSRKRKMPVEIKPRSKRGFIVLMNENKFIFMQVKTRSVKQTPSKKKWSANVTENSHALDLKQDLFKLPSAKKIADALKNAAEKSDRKKSTPYRSAMSMLNFYINRAGKNLSATQKNRLELAKEKLKVSFHQTKK